MPKSTKIKIRSEKKVERNSLWDIFKLGESYTSLVLGIIVVILATILLLAFVKGKNTSTKSEFAKQTKQELNTSTTTQTQNLLTSEQKKSTLTQTSATYTIAEGDTLWNIAEKKYNSGYNWVDIQKANNLTNPDVLFVGTKLTLPNVEPKIATVVKVNNTNQQTNNSIQTNKISGTSYTIVKGDTLWDISVRAYGDGYAWTKISKANNLSNPNIIYSGNKITIPRG
jgi:nucleoid-associated protein YgaU